MSTIEKNLEQINNVLGDIAGALEERTGIENFECAVPMEEWDDEILKLKGGIDAENLEAELVLLNSDNEEVERTTVNIDVNEETEKTKITFRMTRPRDGVDGESVTIDDIVNEIPKVYPATVVVNMDNDSDMIYVDGDTVVGLPIEINIEAFKSDEKIAINNVNVSCEDSIVYDTIPSNENKDGKIKITDVKSEKRTISVNIAVEVDDNYTYHKIFKIYQVQYDVETTTFDGGNDNILIPCDDNGVPHKNAFNDLKVDAMLRIGGEWATITDIKPLTHSECFKFDPANSQLKILNYPGESSPTTISFTITGNLEGEEAVTIKSSLLFNKLPMMEYKEIFTDVNDIVYDVDNLKYILYKGKVTDSDSIIDVKISTFDESGYKQIPVSEIGEKYKVMYCVDPDDGISFKEVTDEGIVLNDIDNPNAVAPDSSLIIQIGKWISTKEVNGNNAIEGTDYIIRDQETIKVDLLNNTPWIYNFVISPNKIHIDKDDNIIVPENKKIECNITRYDPRKKDGTQSIVKLSEVPSGYDLYYRIDGNEGVKHGGANENEDALPLVIDLENEKITKSIQFELRCDENSEQSGEVILTDTIDVNKDIPGNTPIISYLSDYIGAIACDDDGKIDPSATLSTTFIVSDIENANYSIKEVSVDGTTISTYPFNSNFTDNTVTFSNFTDDLSAITKIVLKAEYTVAEKPVTSEETYTIIKLKTAPANTVINISNDDITVPCDNADVPYVSEVSTIVSLAYKGEKLDIGNISIDGLSNDDYSGEAYSEGDYKLTIKNIKNQNYIDGICDLIIKIVSKDAKYKGTGQIKLVKLKNISGEDGAILDLTIDSGNTIHGNNDTDKFDIDEIVGRVNYGVGSTFSTEAYSYDKLIENGGSIKVDSHGDNDIVELDATYFDENNNFHIPINGEGAIDFDVVLEVKLFREDTLIQSESVYYTHDGRDFTKFELEISSNEIDRDLDFEGNITSYTPTNVWISSIIEKEPLKPYKYHVNVPADMDVTYQIDGGKEIFINETGNNELGENGTTNIETKDVNDKIVYRLYAYYDNPDTGDDEAEKGERTEIDCKIIKVQDHKQGPQGPSGQSFNVLGYGMMSCDISDTLMKDPDTGVDVRYLFCEDTGTMYSGNGTSYEELTPEADESVAVSIEGGVGNGNGESGVYCGPLTGPMGESVYLYMAFSNDSRVLENNPPSDIEINLDYGKYAGYWITNEKKDGSPELLDVNNYHWTVGSGDDGFGREQIFLLTKETDDITLENGPAVPEGNSEHNTKGYLPYVSEDLLNVVPSGTTRGSDTPETPTKDYPFCGVVTREFSSSNTEEDNKGKGSKASLYTRYVFDGSSVGHLELDDDQFVIPIEINGDIDPDFSKTPINTKVEFYFANTIKTSVDGVSFESDHDSCNIEGNGDVTIDPTKLNKVKRICITATYENKSYKRFIYFYYDKTAGDIKVDSKIVVKDPDTKLIQSDYSIVTGCVYKGNGTEYKSSDPTMDFVAQFYTSNQNTASSEPISTSNGQFTIDLSDKKDLSKIRICLKDDDQDYEIFEEIGVIQDGAKSYAYHLELSEDNITVPIFEDGSVDPDFKADTTALFYKGEEDISNGSNVTYFISYDGSEYLSSEDNVITIGNNALNEKPNQIYVKATLNLDGKSHDFIKICRLFYKQNPIEMSINKQVLYRDPYTGKINDTVDVHITKGDFNKNEYKNIEGRKVYCTYTLITGDQETGETTIIVDPETTITEDFVKTNKNGIASFKVEEYDVQKILFEIRDAENLTEAYEEIHVIQDGRDGATEESIYYRCNEYFIGYDGKVDLDFLPNPTPTDTSGDYQNPNGHDAEHNGIEGTDEASGVNKNNRYEYQCIRKYSQGVGGSFSDPILGTYYPEDGAPGESTINVILSNEHITFQYNEKGGLDGADRGECIVTVLEGMTDVTRYCTITANIDGYGVPSVTVGSDGPTISVEPDNDTPTQSGKYIVNITVSYKGKTITKLLEISCTNPSGESPIILDLEDEGTLLSTYENLTDEKILLNTVTGFGGNTPVESLSLKSVIIGEKTISSEYYYFTPVNNNSGTISLKYDSYKSGGEDSDQKEPLIVKLNFNVSYNNGNITTKSVSGKLSKSNGRIPRMQITPSIIHYGKTKSISCKVYPQLTLINGTVVNGGYKDCLTYQIDDGPEESLSDQGFLLVNTAEEQVVINIYSRSKELIDQETIPVVRDGSDGEDGNTPYIEDGTGHIGTTDTGISAAGDVGTIGDDGYGYKNDEKTTHIALGKDGETPKMYINSEGYGVINGEPTDTLAIGVSVESMNLVYSIGTLDDPGDTGEDTLGSTILGEDDYIGAKPVYKYTSHDEPVDGKPYRIDKGLKGDTGKAGVSITEVYEEYTVSSSKTIFTPIKTDDGHESYPTYDDDNQYVGSRTVIKYSEGNPTYTIPKLSTGAKGAKGDPGETIEISSVDIYYKNSTIYTYKPSTMDPTDGSTTFTAPTLEGLGTYESIRTVYSDGSFSGTTPRKLSKTIASVKELYAVHSNNVTAPTTGGAETYTITSTNPYVGAKTVGYDEGDVKQGESKAVCVTPTNGHSPYIENGTGWVGDEDSAKYVNTNVKASGVGVVSVDVYYRSISSSSTITTPTGSSLGNGSTTFPPSVVSGYVVYESIRTQFDNDTYSGSTPKLIDSSVTSTKELYYLSTSSTDYVGGSGIESYTQSDASGKYVGCKTEGYDQFGKLVSAGIPICKSGLPGAKGDNAEFYTLHVDQNCIFYYNDSTYNPNGKITPYLMYHNGSSTTKQTYIPTGYKIGLQYGTGTPVNQTSLASAAVTGKNLTTNNVESATIYLCLSTIAADSVSSTFLDKVTVTLQPVNDGESGSAPVIYPAGEGKSGTTYSGTATLAPYVLYDNNRYIAGGIPPTSSLAYPGSSSYTTTSPDGNNVPTTAGSGKGVKMTSFEAIYADIGYLNTAKVGPALFYDNYVYSQDGGTSPETATTWFNFNSGAGGLANNTISGTSDGKVTLGSGVTINGTDITSTGTIPYATSTDIANATSGMLTNSDLTATKLITTINGSSVTTDKILASKIQADELIVKRISNNGKFDITANTYIDAVNSKFRLANGIVEGTSSSATIAGFTASSNGLQYGTSFFLTKERFSIVSSTGYLNLNGDCGDTIVIGDSKALACANNDSVVTVISGTKTNSLTTGKSISCGGNLTVSGTINGGSNLAPHGGTIIINTDGRNNSGTGYEGYYNVYNNSSSSKSFNGKSINKETNHLFKYTDSQGTGVKQGT